MKINIFARHCKFSANSANKARPSWFNREGVFCNMLNTLDEKCNLIVCFDGEIEKSDHFLNKACYHDTFLLIEKKGGTDAASFLNTIETARERNIKDDDIIYFVEDDYLHYPGWPEIMREGFIQTQADYITLYDHNDKYFFPMYEELLSKVIATQHIHWKSIPNTTNTYACLAKTFKRDFLIHKQFCDLSRGFTRDFDKFAFLMEQGKSLISCIPGYSTHCEPEFMSPVVDWENVYKKTSIL